MEQIAIQVDQEVMFDADVILDAVYGLSRDDIVDFIVQLADREGCGESVVSQLDGVMKDEADDRQEELQAQIDDLESQVADLEAQL